MSDGDKMRVESIENIDKKKVKVVLGDGTILPLYKGELKKYDIKEEALLKEEQVDFLKEDLLYKRAKERALYILERSDKTKKQLEDKLSGGSYPPDIIKKVISFLEAYGYIDDESYARNFVSVYIESKSIMYIQTKLLQKGIDKNLVDDILEEYKESSVYNPKKLIREIVNRKRFVYKEGNYKENNKIVSHLLRKGFKYDDVIEVIKCERISSADN